MLNSQIQGDNHPLASNLAQIAEAQFPRNFIPAPNSLGQVVAAHSESKQCSTGMQFKHAIRIQAHGLKLRTEYV